MRKQNRQQMLRVVGGRGMTTSAWAGWRVAQRVGIPLAEIARAVAELPDQRTPSAHDWAGLADRWRADLDDRIATLIQLGDQFSDRIGCGYLSLHSCILAVARSSGGIDQAPDDDEAD